MEHSKINRQMTGLVQRKGARGALVLLAAAVGLQGCEVGPSFKRPDTPTPGTYLPQNEGKPAAAEGKAPAAPSTGDFEQHIMLGSAPGGDWWNLFQSPALDGLIHQAVASSHTLAAARAAVAEAREVVAAESGMRYPELDVNAGAGRQQYGAQFLGAFSIPPFSYTAIGASVRYVLDYTGGIARSIEQRQALVRYQESEREAAYLTLTGSIATQVVIVAATRAEIQALADLLSQDQANLDLVRTAFNNGSVSRVDVLTAQSQLASDQTLMPPLRHRLAVASHALAVLAGQAPAQWSAPNFDLAQLKLPRELPVRLPSELVHRRPDILAAEAQLHAATAAVGVATANLYPQIVLSATGGMQHEGLAVDHLFDSTSAAWTLISSLTAPVFDGGTRRAERRAAVDELRVSAERYQQTVLTSFGEVADLLDALTHDAGLLAAQANALQTAESSLDLARESYRAGNSGLLQILDAQRQRQQAQLGFVRAQAQQYLDTIQLLLAVGGTLST
jgi:NodT family efflux transporter outer membrane factor (OMF) lipoprotein